jgi:hypothetical protein
MTNPYAPLNNESDELEQRRLEMLKELEMYRWKFYMDDINNYLYGAILILILLMLALTIKVEITVNELYYLCMGLLVISLAIDIYVILRYRKTR